MEDQTRKRRRDMVWALPASILLHVLVVAALVTYSQTTLPQLVQEDAVNVTLAPPPEQPKPEPTPPPAAQDRQAAKPPEPDKTPAPADQAARQPQIEVLKPVFRFGEKDAGPGGSPDQARVDEKSPVSTEPPPSDPSDVVNEAPDKAASVPVDPAQGAESSESATVPNQDASEQGADERPGQVDGKEDPLAKPSGLSSPAGEDGDIALPAMAKAPQPRPATTPSSALKQASGASTRRSPAKPGLATSQPYSGLPGVRRTEGGATGAAVATSSMAGIPRDKRAGRLCASALQQQLLADSYSPDLIPLVPLRSGNVLEVQEAAFRTRTAWRALSFRCEVDTEATTIKSLSYRVGARIPRDQWARLGLPAND